MDSLAKEKLRKHGLFDARVPRFTSYPPANRFSTAVGGPEARRWRSTAPDGAEISLYVHIPFCRRLCWFCACRTQGTKTDAPLGRYISTVLAEARAVRADLPDTIRLKRLHLGGGTPTILPVPLMEELLGGLQDIFGFDEIEEFAVEIDPTEVDLDRIACLARYGMNRASLGVQDFEPEVQQAIGRWQSSDQTGNVAGMLRACGVKSLNFDLLYGLPFQTEETMLRTLEQVLDLGPSRLALFGYAHVPWMSKRQVVVPSDALPGTETRYELFELARMQLMSAGFRQIGIDHFATPDDSLTTALEGRRLARSFQGYTDDRISRLIGLGASAISRYPEGYVQNQPATAMYQTAVANAQSTVSRGVALNASEAARAAMIEQLMCYGDVILDDLPGAKDEAAGWLKGLADKHGDAVTLNDNGLSIYPWAQPLVRMIAADIANESANDKAYSSAI